MPSLIAASNYGFNGTIGEEMPEKPSEINPFDDDEEITAQCDLENPESCDSCQ